MDVRGDKSLSSLGFLTVVDSQKHGLFGGYLVLSPTGRPLEFHCTEPVKASRAQEILYGPTLESYLYGQQLGQSLLESAEKNPPVVLTDIPPVLAVCEFTSVPVLLVERAGLGNDSQRTHKRPKRRKKVAETASTVDGPSDDVDGHANEGGADQPGAVRDLEPGDRFRLIDPTGRHDTVANKVRLLGRQIDVGEPFERIRQAIEEAQRGSQNRPAA